ncbi:nucleotide-binding protein, partial [bacterium]
MNRCAAALLAVMLSTPALAFPGAGGSIAPRVIKGTVSEALPAGTYTYLLIKTPSGEEWAAVQKTELKKGAAVAVTESTVMEDFDSPILKRKFKKVVFGVIAAKESAAPAA